RDAFLRHRFHRQGDRGPAGLPLGASPQSEDPMRRFAVTLWILAAAPLIAQQVTYERLLNADREPANWMTYSGTYRSWRYSPLDQIHRENVQKLKLKWVYQMSTQDVGTTHQVNATHTVETTPLVVDGIMYFSE